MTDIDVARDDLALDALAAGSVPPGDDAVLGLLHAFRTDLEPEAGDGAVVVPLRRPRRRFALIALSAAAGLVLGGLTAGAVVTSDQPGQLFYAAHKAVLGDPKAAERVTKLLDDAAERIAKRDLRGARDKLAKAAEALADVDDPAERDALRSRLRTLSALASPVATPSATPSPDDERETPEPGETESPDDESGSGGSGSDDSGSDDSTSDSPVSDDSGSDSSGSGDSGPRVSVSPLDDSSGGDDHSGSGGGGSDD